MHMDAQGWEHRIGHSGLIEPRHVLRKQLDQRRQSLRYRRRRAHRTATGLHLCRSLQSLQHLFQSVRHPLARFLQCVLYRLAPLFRARFAPVIRYDGEHLLQRIPADAANGDRQFKSQRIAVALHRLMPVIKQLPVLGDDVGKSNPIVGRIGIVRHRRHFTFSCLLIVFRTVAL